MMKNEYFSNEQRQIAAELADLCYMLELRSEQDAGLFIDALFPEFEVKVAAGVYRIAFIFPDFVVKVPRVYFETHEDAVEAMHKEARYISARLSDELLEPFFPQTEMQIGTRHFTPALLQERIRGIGTARYAERMFAESMAVALGIGFDMHGGNYGFRTIRGRRTPVFVDCDSKWEQWER